MLANRIFYVLIVLALAVVIFFAFQQALAAGAIAGAGQSNTQAMQWEDAILRGHRGGMKPDLFINGQTISTAGANEP
jgi:hypothetical protein